LDESEVVGGALVPSDEESSKAVEPGMADFDHPTPRRMPLWIAWRRQRLLGGGFGRDVRREAVFLCLLTAHFVVVAPIQTQVLLLRRLFGRLFGHQGSIEQLAQLLHVLAIGPCDHNGQRHTGSIGQEVALGAALAAVGGVAPGGLRLSLDPFFGRAP